MLTGVLSAVWLKSVCRRLNGISSPLEDCVSLSLLMRFYSQPVLPCHAARGVWWGTKESSWLWVWGTHLPLLSFPLCPLSLSVFFPLTFPPHSVGSHLVKGYCESWVNKAQSGRIDTHTHTHTHSYPPPRTKNDSTNWFLILSQLFIFVILSFMQEKYILLYVNIFSSVETQVKHLMSICSFTALSNSKELYNHLQTYMRCTVWKITDIHNIMSISYMVSTGWILLLCGMQVSLWAGFLKVRLLPRVFQSLFLLSVTHSVIQIMVKSATAYYA